MSPMDTAAGGGPLLAVNGLGKRFGGFVALESIDLTIATEMTLSAIISV